MGEHVDRLLAQAATASAEELAALQVAAANERLAEQRTTTTALDRRAQEAGIDAITSTADLVPLLFAHSVYKSYPESFLVDGRWDRMTMWLDTITTCSVRDIDLAGVEDADDWIARLRKGGVHLIVSSGTSGKHSFLPLSEDDIAFVTRVGEPMSPRPVTFLGPSNAPMRTAYNFRARAAAYGRPGAVHSLEAPLRVADQIRAAAVRRKMANETAVPSEVAALRDEAARNAAEREKELADLLAAVVGHRHEPQVVMGGWPMLWRVLEAARAEGIPDGSFHPDTIVVLGGGLKGAVLPDGFDNELRSFFAPVPVRVGYGMSELSGGFFACDEGNYHCPPWIVPLVVDESGERLLDVEPGGRVRGRFAAYDAAWEGIWGGVVSGDQVTVDYGPCGCGRPGPTLGPDIVRYSELSAAGDDKLTCGGTIESYIRGMVEA